MFNEAYLKSATVENAVSGFKTTGIHPFNANIIPDSEYLQDPRNNAAIEVDNDNARSAESLPSEPVAGPSNEDHTDDVTAISETPDPFGEETIILPASDISFEEILAVPKIMAKKSTRRSEESEIITSSPYKKRLTESDKSKKEKEEKKQERKKKKIVKASNKIKPSKKKESKKPLEKKSKKNSQDWKCLICDGLWWSHSLVKTGFSAARALTAFMSIVAHHHL